LDNGARWGRRSADELIGARYLVPGCDKVARTVEAPENGGTAQPNSAARTANRRLNV